MSESEQTDPRRPRRLYAVGQEPDPRFSLANERTALAWVRTALALVAAGVGLTSVAQLVGDARLLHLLAVLMCLGGGVVAVSAVLGWLRKEHALRTGRPLPAPTALPWLAAVVAAVGVAVAGYVLTQL